MKDPFCKYEVLDPEMERMIERIQCGYYDRDDDEQNALVDYEPEVVVWRNPDGTEVVQPIPPNIRGTPEGTRIEIKNLYRGFYVREGIMIVTEKCEVSLEEGHLFERVWVKCNSHRKRIEPEWKVLRIS